MSQRVGGTWQSAASPTQVRRKPPDKYRALSTRVGGAKRELTNLAVWAVPGHQPHLPLVCPVESRCRPCGHLRSASAAPHRSSRPTSATWFAVSRSHGSSLTVTPAISRTAADGVRTNVRSAATRVCGSSSPRPVSCLKNFANWPQSRSPELHAAPT